MKTLFTVGYRRHCYRKCQCCVMILYAVLQAACDDSGSNAEDSRVAPSLPQLDGDSNLENMPWVGNWIQVNFLDVDDNGIWSQDILEGIGFTAMVTDSTWVETDSDGVGCSVTYDYSVQNDLRFSKAANAVSPNCPFALTSLLNGSGVIEFTDGYVFMIEHFDLLPDDTIFAFKWMRQ